MSEKEPPLWPGVVAANGGRDAKNVARTRRRLCYCFVVAPPAALPRRLFSATVSSLDRTWCLRAAPPFARTLPQHQPWGAPVAPPFVAGDGDWSLGLPCPLTQIVGRDERTNIGEPEERSTEDRALRGFRRPKSHALGGHLATAELGPRHSRREKRQIERRFFAIRQEELFRPHQPAAKYLSVHAQANRWLPSRKRNGATTPSAPCG